MALHLTSSAFSEGAAIPTKFTCEGEAVSPALLWNGAPPYTKSFALMFHDPDASSDGFTHWVLYDVPATTHALDEGTTGVGIEGVTGLKKPGYVGPCPPPGGPHHYGFQLFALDVDSLGHPGMSRDEVLAAVKGHVLAETTLMGTYERFTK